jgi:hypothetical protein
MNVDALLLHLSNMSQFLREAGAAKPANDLRDACDLLRPFQGQKLESLVKDIAKAQELLLNGPTAKRGKVNPAEYLAISDRLAALHERASRPGLLQQEIDEIFAAANLDVMTEKQLVEIAARLNVPKLKGKPKIIAMMKKAVADRMGAGQRYDA